MGSRQDDLRCRVCGHGGREESDDGFYYCEGCGAQLDIVTGDDDYFLTDMTIPRHTRSQAPQLNPNSQSFLRLFTQQDTIKIENVDPLDSTGPTDPEDFAYQRESTADYYREVRIRYVMGMQWMIQMQCEALVEKFNVHPLICGVASTIWLRFLAHTGVFQDDWAENLVLGDSDEPWDKLMYQRAVMILFRNLQKTIPLPCSLAISLLACHVAREAILLTDILKWALEGKLPYYAAHVEIGKHFESLLAPAYCITLSRMFRPVQTVPVQRLEAMAATIAESIGLHLPPVNFYGIASRYLKKLSISDERVLSHACRIYEWSMPPDLWFSASDLRIPSRVCVMSILIVAIRIVYNINGFGVWERSLSNCGSSPSSSQHTNELRSTSTSRTHGAAENVPGYPLDKMVDDSSRDALKVPSCERTSQLDSSDLLNQLEATYKEMGVSCEFTKDLPLYLEYCKDVVFAGSESSHVDRTEEFLKEKLWDFYQNAKDSNVKGMLTSSPLNRKRSRNDDGSVKDPVEKEKDCEQRIESPSADMSVDNAVMSEENHCISKDSQKKNKDGDEKQKDKAIRQLKIDMENDRFYYIPPRVKVKKLDYLHYARRKDEGALSYVAHADYYILLRACARVAEVEIRNMHNGVLSFEKRLAWLEKRIECCLHLTVPTVTCKFCTDNDSVD
ncbi:TATA box-binding protein-associated factor RNA polymerase I subunit B [Euphorbia peplus]|nr:TATA box-binding protein-associated factor RNA polymerase I subunit B [Euphorbia peplus]